MNTVNKAVTLLFWLLVVVTSLIPFDGVLSWLPAVGLFVLFLHVIEIIWFWLGYRQHSSNPKLDAFYILIFGIFHFKQFIRKS